MVIENGVNGIKVNNINYYIHFNCVIVHIFYFTLGLAELFCFSNMMVFRSVDGGDMLASFQREYFQCEQ